MTLTVFWVLGVIAMLGALLCITRKSPVASALWLVATLFAIAAMYVMLDAPFIAVLQIIVYAGAIMVLFLFVIMLLNLGRPGPTDIKGPLGIGIAVVLAGLLLFQLRALSHAGPSPAAELPAGGMAALQEREGIVAAVARPLFETYLIPFEIASVLLLAAMVGAVVLAKRRL